ncbi:hypothetical protein CAPTEDRAFT_208672 [Capitella teleta]|uniref:Ashwin n=1 Tax=Capitella teleta TaxID=283909 RepID=R7TNG9_CAPTE|nr:hypothetical protein CAPTEDRAFT_208672 [Capitella teleta]|eukprot:ELT95398.1 hypothetical protein CAPTEDRAFT_208672 [Capitella teleta]
MTGEEKPNESDALEMLQPEIMAPEAILGLIKENNVKLERESELSKDELVELFYKHVAPQPQRKYRKNRGGQKLTMNQVALDKHKRKHSDENSVERYSHLHALTSAHSSLASPKKSGLITTFDIPTVERLKPPPSAINMQRKTIKLSGGASKSETSSKQGNTKVEKATDAQSKVKTTAAAASVPRKLKLTKKSNGSEPTPQSTAETANTSAPTQKTEKVDGVSSAKKFKRSSIQWP